ncbi:hypothetical protein HED60_18815 [Planctomycetales bacterium ZRK34]|nr:hypothetical protein HED60_18815 [Planctomycetales bacterium ZRK34]
MIYSATPRLSSNLTIALIQRDQRYPEWAARRRQHQLATRLAAAQRGHYLPAAYRNVDASASPESTIRPATWCYRFTPTACESANQNPPAAVQPYMPHAIPTNPYREYPQKSASWTADQMDRLIDLYA